MDAELYAKVFIMNETGEIKEFMLQTLKESKDFVVEQSPEVIQQYLGTQYLEATICFWVFGVVSILALVTGLYLLIKKPFKTVYTSIPDDYSGSYVGAIFFGVVFIFTLAISATNLTNKLKIEHYPKGYLLERVIK